jgi:hypothetical protein
VQDWLDNDSKGATAPGRLNYLGILALIFLAGVAARFYRVGEQILIDDEWHALNAVQHHDLGWIFTHFGISDHSIPLTLFYEMEYQLVGLSELLMRWPMLLAGCISVLLLPYLLRHWLKKPEHLVFAALLALSPVLIYYSRFARPYALLALLEVAALLMAWHWWQQRKTSQAAAWIILTVVCVWLNAPAAVMVAPPFFLFSILALANGVRHHNWRDLGHLLAVGISTAIPLAALLGPPLITEPWAISGKGGQHYINAQTLPWAISLASGSGRAWVWISMTVLAILGSRVLLARDRAFARYLLAAITMAALMLCLTGAAWAMHGNVFLRYLIGLLPLYLMFVTLGLVEATQWLVSKSRAPSSTTGIILAALVVSLVIQGPIPDWPIRINQFQTHQNYHFNYNWEDNIYIQHMAGWYRPEDFYAEIAAEHEPAEAVIVVAPWNLASFANPMNLQQEVHRQKVLVGFVNGVCSEPFFGEITAGQPGMKFRNFVPLQDILDGKRRADYLVLVRQYTSNLAIENHMDFDRCEQAARDRFGDPWRETEFSVVFRIAPDHRRHHEQP